MTRIKTLMNRTFLPSLALLFLVTLFGGCSGYGPQENLGENYYFRKTTKFGVILYSQVSDQSTNRIFMKKADFDSPGLGYTSYIAHPFRTPMISTENYQGNVSSIALPEDDYQLYRWQLQKGSTVLQGEYWEADFHVKAQHIIYLGRFIMHRKDNQTWLEVEDHLEEDLKMLEAQSPKLIGVPLIKHLAPSVPLQESP